MERVKGLDLYLLLDVETDADEKTIRKAYRKKALTCHPDKNKDNKEAIALFHQLSDALTVLVDESTRRAYDNVLKARKAAEIRSRQLDGKRRKLKDDLEQRERDAKYEEEYSKKSEEDKLAREIERLRKQGSKQLEEEQELMKRQLAEEGSKPRPATAQQTNNSATPARIKVKWTVTDDSPYNKESLESIFNKYGNVTAVVVNKQKGNSALVEFEDINCARMASTIETGFLNHKLKIKVLFDEAPDKPVSQQAKGPSLSSDHDFESVVLMKLRREEERKRLIAQMLAEDEAS